MAAIGYRRGIFGHILYAHKTCSDIAPKLHVFSLVLIPAYHMTIGLSHMPHYIEL